MFGDLVTKGMKGLVLQQECSVPVFLFSIMLVCYS